MVLSEDQVTSLQGLCGWLRRDLAYTGFQISCDIRSADETSAIRQAEHFAQWAIKWGIKPAGQSSMSCEQHILEEYRAEGCYSWQYYCFFQPEINSPAL